MKKYIVVLTISLILFSCRKQKEYEILLPAETSVGKNTMGFLYNGSNIWNSFEHGIFFLNDKPDDIPNAKATLYHQPSGILSISLTGQMSTKNNNAEITNNSSIVLTIQNLNISSSTYSFDTLSTSNFVYFENILTSKYYANYSNNSFNLKFTKIDTLQKIISGNFSGNLFNKNGTVFNLNEKTNIDNGRFDIKYIDLY